jgi:hypothetical protein
MIEEDDSYNIDNDLATVCNLVVRNISLKIRLQLKNLWTVLLLKK